MTRGDKSTHPYFPDFGKALQCALDANEPALIEVPITHDATSSGAEPAGWWDFLPAPDASSEVKDNYLAAPLGATTFGCKHTEYRA